MSAVAVGVDLLRRAGAVPGQSDVDGVRARFDALAGGPEAPPTVLVGACEPTAAFTGRDALLPGYDAAREVAAAHGYEAVLRHVGGHLAAYDPGCVVLHAWAPSPEPARDVHRRFAVLGGALADGLTALGVPDVRVGEVPGEYCSGRWSVNAGGTRKLVGTGQRMSRHGWVFSAVVTVTSAAALTEVLAGCYGALDLPFEPSTVGGVADLAPGVRPHDVAETLAGALRRCLQEEGPL